MISRNNPPDTIPVWNLFIRVSHWLVAGLVLFNLFNEEGDELHRYAGYVVAGVVGLRIIYGLTRPAADPARISLPGVASLKSHLHELLARQVGHTTGHNPFGMVMIVLIWMQLLGLGLTGWLSQLDALWGEDWPIDIHETIVLLLQACIIIHLAGVAVMSWLQHENLIKAMITGRKKRSPH